MDIKFIKNTNLDYQGEYVGVIETALSDEEMKSQIIAAIVDPTNGYDLHARDIRLDLMTNDITVGAEKRKLVRVEVRFNKHSEDTETKSVTLKEYA